MLIVNAHVFCENPSKPPNFGEFGPQFRACESQFGRISTKKVELMFYIDHYERSVISTKSVWFGNCRFHHVVPTFQFVQRDHADSKQRHEKESYNAVMKSNIRSGIVGDYSILHKPPINRN